MNVGDHVYLDDASGRNYGKVTTRGEDGICHIKWDSGITEVVHESELKLAINPSLVTATGDAMVTGLQDAGYEPDDPKHPSWRERVAELWDSRRGK